MEENPIAIELRELISKQSNIKLISFNNYEEYNIIELNLNDKKIKLTTDLSTYCYCESNDLNLDELNSLFIINKF